MGGGRGCRKLGWQTDNKTRHRGVHQPGAHRSLFGSPPLNFSLSDRRFESGRGCENRN